MNIQTTQPETTISTKITITRTRTTTTKAKNNKKNNKNNKNNNNNNKITFLGFDKNEVYQVWTNNP